jgi:rfaE bifunctional protein kinase chain/domain
MSASHALNVNTLEGLLDSLAGQSLIVLGDVFLDEYVVGRAERLSREAPVPVLEFRARRRVPGGGANPAMNAAALGAKASQIGVVGDDSEAASVRDLLAGAGVDVSGLITDPSRPTITKTRIVAEGEQRFPQQLARVDRGSREPLTEAMQARVIAEIRRLTVEKKAAAILCSDYRAGLITQAVADAVRDAATEHRLLLTADTQGELDKYGGFGLVKCNRAEAEAFLGRRLASDDDVAQAMNEVSEQLNIGAVLITRGAQGVSVGVRGLDGGCTHIPAANVSEVYDVTGAGDTVIAAATLALMAGADPLTAARLANVAAGLVVRRWGNAVVTREELREEIGKHR